MNSSFTPFVPRRRNSLTSRLLAAGNGGALSSFVMVSTAVVCVPSDAPDALDADGEPHGLSGEPTAYPGLYFVGFTHSLRGHLFEANLASKRLARNVSSYLSN